MLQNDLTGAAVLIIYYLVFTIFLPTAFKVWLKVASEIVRKIQHISYSLSIFLLLELFSAWYISILAAFSLVVLGYPILILIEKSLLYRKTFVDREKKGGELRKQLLCVQLSFALLISIFWGFFGIDWRYVIAVAIMAWGFGDAAAALIGKAYGRKRILHHFIDFGKTYEGTAAMFVFSGLATFLTLLIYGNHPWHISLFLSIIVAIVSAIIELFSRRGFDTLTVPLSAAFSIMPLIYLIYFLGW